MLIALMYSRSVSRFAIGPAGAFPRNREPARISAPNAAAAPLLLLIFCAPAAGVKLNARPAGLFKPKDGVSI